MYLVCNILFYFILFIIFFCLFFLSFVVVVVVVVVAISRAAPVAYRDIPRLGVQSEL